MPENTFPNFVRVVRNLYNAVFEHGVAHRQNSPLRYSVSNQDIVNVSDDYLLYFSPYLRAYADMTAASYTEAGGLTTGTNMRYPSKIFDDDPSQGWVFFRIQPTWVYTDDSPGQFPIVFDWNNGVDGQERIVLYYDTTIGTHAWGVYKRNAGGSYLGGISIPGSHAANQWITLAFSWNLVSNTMWVDNSVNTDGHASITLTGMANRMLAFGYGTVDGAPNVDIEAKVGYVIAGTGQLSQAAYDAIVALGADPEVEQLYAIEGIDLSFYWKGTNLTHEGVGRADAGIAG